MNLDAFVVKYAPITCKGILLALALCGAVIFGVAIDAPAMSPFAAFGALFAFSITPRHGAWSKIIGAGAGGLFLLLAASLSVLVAGLPLIALVLLFILSWLAALPKNDSPYPGFVIKYATIAVLLNYFDFSLSWPIGLYFGAGLLLGVFLSLAATAFEQEDQPRPMDQLRAFLHGDINNPWLSLRVPVTVVISSLIAETFSYANPAWVGLTVIFVASADDNLELKRAMQRVIGTVAGTVIAYLMLRWLHLPLRLALIAGVFAFFVPLIKQYYAIFSAVITCLVLILIYISMFAHGGDMGLLLWRSIDTIFGCACVLASNLIIRYLQWRKQHKKPAAAAQTATRALHK